MTTRECVHLVTGSYSRSRNENGGHAIRSTVAENAMLHANFTALCAIQTACSREKCTKFNAPSFCNRLQFTHAVFTKMLSKDRRLSTSQCKISICWL